MRVRGGWTKRGGICKNGREAVGEEAWHEGNDRCVRSSNMIAKMRAIFNGLINTASVNLFMT